MIVTLAEDLEQKLGASRRQRHIAEFIDDQKLVGGELSLEAQEPLLIARLHELMDKPGGGHKSDRHAALTGGEAESQSDVALACAAVAKRDDVLAPQDVFAPRQFQDQHLVERGNGVELETVDPLHGWKARGVNAALHHEPFTGSAPRS